MAKPIAPIYKGRIFPPCGVYSQRMQSVLDVIDLVASVQYHEPQLLSSASVFVVARRYPSSAVAGADACRVSALRCGFLTVDGDDSLLLWLKHRSVSVSESCKGERSWEK
jgi:hypothetical protein